MRSIVSFVVMPASRTAIVSLQCEQRPGRCGVTALPPEPAPRGPADGPTNAARNLVDRGVKVGVDRLGHPDAAAAQGDDDAAPLVDPAAAGVHVLQPDDDLPHE